MRNIHHIFVALLALLFASCAKSEVEMPQAAGMGAVAFNIEAQTRSGEYDPMDYCTLRIYSQEGLVRKYTSLEEIPQVLNLVAGNYTADVELGDGALASFTSKSYHGEQPFEVVAGAQTPVEVVCQVRNATVEVNYDESVAANLEAEFLTSVVLYDASSTLDFTASGEGYFLPESEGEELSWSFKGNHPEKGAITKEGTIAIKAGGKYRLNFAFSPDATGLLNFEIEVVEPTPENGGDVIIFSPEPVIKGDGFDIATTQVLFNASRKVSVTSPNALSALTLEVDGQFFDLANATVEGVTVVKSDDKNWSIEISDAFFSPFVGGDHALNFTATDVEGGTGRATATFTTQGIVPATAADCNLWTNTGAIHVKIYDPNIQSVAVKMRRAGGEWFTYTATRSDESTFTAVVEPEWAATTNSAGATAYKPNTATGIFANASYEARAIIDGVEKSATAAFATTVSQPIPYADFEDGSISCFSKSNSNAPFWGSGNNTFKSSLCVQSTFSGMGGSHCVKMQTSATLGYLASGNLFTGRFLFDMGSQTGTVCFGQNYDWKARPSAIRFKYHATVGKATMNKYKDESGVYPVKEGEQDKARVYAMIVDWSSQPEVTSGSGQPTGCFDPAGITSLPAGKVIAAAVLMIDSSTSDSSMVTAEVPFIFYDKITKPTATYKLVIAAAGNAYGDYMCGCEDNCLYVDDFEWVY